MSDPLKNISLLDGRYKKDTEKLSDYFSESALIRFRILVDIEYLIALAHQKHINELDPISKTDKSRLRKLYISFSVEAACSCFIYSMNIADKFICSGDSSCALVVGADTLSRITDWTDRNTCGLFADGAGAAILQPSDTPGVLFSELGADGAYGDLLYVPYGTSRKPEQPKPDDYCLHMKGNEVFKVAVKTLESITLEALAKQNININDIDWLIPHQANTRIIHSVAKRLSIPIEKVIITLQKHGNTSAASIPLALDEGINSGKISSGDTILMLGFGAGFTWGTMIITL